MDRSAIQKVLVEHFEKLSGIACVYLFGSFARGVAHAQSDVDIAVLYEQTPPSTLLDQPYADEATLAAKLQRPVQIVVMNNAPADLVHRILRDGVLLLEPNKSQRIAFEVRARNEYFDLLPILRQYRQGASA